MDVEELEGAIHGRTNAARIARDRTPLAHDPDLRPVARYHSRRMATAGRIFHEAPDGETLGDRLEKLRYDLHGKTAGQPFCHECGSDLRALSTPRYCGACGTPTLNAARRGGAAGENLAHWCRVTDAGSATVDEVAIATVEGWLDSPGHRENLLNERFGREAVGVVIRRERGLEVYVTQVFS